LQVGEKSPHGGDVVEPLDSSDKGFGPRFFIAFFP
jgi:hypothetical protein